MAREIIDNPGGWSRSLPGHTVEFEAGFAQPWYSGTSVSVNSGASTTYTVTITDTEHIFFVDMVNVSPQAFKEHSVLVYVNDIPYAAAASQGWSNIPLRQNPSIQLIAGDHIDVVVTNLDASARTFLIKINGTKIMRPADYGHAPGAYFTIDDHSIAKGEHIHCTDGSSNTPTSWDWDFGDGSEHSTEQNPTHIYTVAGSYYPKLRATNQYGFDYYAESTPVVVT